MTDSFSRPYMDAAGNLIYLTDEQYAARQETDPVRRITPSISQNLTQGGQAADRGPIEPTHGVPEVRERDE